MPRPSKGARLYVKRQRGRQPVYVIRDGEKEVSTGCPVSDVERAKKALEKYMAENYRPDTSLRSLKSVNCADVLMLYLMHLPSDSPSRDTIGYHIKALNSYWGDKSLADVKGSTCRQYQEFRPVKASTVRQELKTFQAAIKHWHREGALEAIPQVTLPKAASRRERWLTRDEVAALLRACRRLSREGHKAANGAIQRTDYSYVQRFILIGVYTGTRHDACIRLAWNRRDTDGHIDLGRGVIYRRGAAEADTTKRRPPVSVSGTVLYSHLRRWKRMDTRDELAFVIHYKGQRVTKMRRAWNTVRKAAGLGGDVTPHTLRHTCASWLLWGRDGKAARPMTKPLTIWETAEVLGCDASTVERVYGHHRRPDNG